ncbi:MAG TPA: helical backbone metal receptor [Phycisphaerae bacterium]|nr:helical backbone metal receptor [Phycisphaerae bacterium]
MRRLVLLILVGGIAAVGFYVRFSRMAELRRAKAPPTATTRPADPDWLRDYVGQTVLPDADELTKGPGRIISLAPNITELCAALGLADRIVGRTQFCLHPPSAQRATVVGGYVDPNLERIVALRPDLVLITTSSTRLREKLTALDLPVKEVPDSSLEDIFEAVRLLGEYTDRPKTAARLVRDLRRDLDRLAMQPPPASLRVLVVVGEVPAMPGPVYVAGPGSYLDSLVKLAGHENALAGKIDRAWAEVSAETLLAVKPDAILETRRPERLGMLAAVYEAWADFAAVPAITNRRICSITDDFILIPGPRVNIALYKVIEALSPVPVLH